MYLSTPITYQQTPTTGSYSGSVEYGVKLAGHSFVRRFGQSNWTKIRMGFRFRLSSSNEVLGGTIPDTPAFTFGLCHQTDNIPGDKTVTQFIGASAQDTDNVVLSGSQWFFQGTSISRNINVASASLGDLQINTASVSWAFGTLCAVTDTASLGTIILEISRSSVANTSSFTTTVFQKTSVLPLGDYFLSGDFNLAMSGSLSRTGYTSEISSDTTLPLEAQYPLNAVSIYWGRLDPVMEICDLQVIRMENRGTIYAVALTYDPFEAYTASLDISGSGRGH